MIAQLVASGGISDFFEQAGVATILTCSLALNITTTLSAILMWRAVVGDWGDNLSKTGLAGERRAVVLVLSTTIANTLVVLPSWWLWRQGFIELGDLSWLDTVVDLVVLSIVVDIAMYAVHRAFHVGVLYRWFHSWHHADDDKSSALLLLVMHPLEAAGFGLLITLIMLVWTISVPAVAAFFVLNLIVGVGAHIPPDKLGPVFGRFPMTRWAAGFHEMHHAHPDRNFGFFSPFWDRLARSENLAGSGPRRGW